MIEATKVKSQRPPAKDQIIVALDVETAAQAREIVSGLRGEVGAFKIGLQLFTAAGASLVREVVSAGERVFLDVKFHDIPNTVAKASIEAARLGVWMFNIHASGGGEMMRRAAEGVSEICAKENLEKPKLIGVTVLTSADQTTLEEIGVASGMETQVLRLAHLAAAAGLDGVVASAREIKTVRAGIADENFLIVTPGIRPISATNDDQKRVMTPTQAVLKGSDYLVIGRPIITAEDKTAAVREIVREIESGIKNF